MTHTHFVFHCLSTMPGSQMKSRRINILLVKSQVVVSFLKPSAISLYELLNLADNVCEFLL